MYQLKSVRCLSLLQRYPLGILIKIEMIKKGKRTGAHRPQHDCCSLILSLLATQSGLNEGHKKDARRTQEK